MNNICNKGFNDIQIRFTIRGSENVFTCNISPIYKKISPEFYDMLQASIKMKIMYFDKIVLFDKICTFLQFFDEIYIFLRFFDDFCRFFWQSLHRIHSFFIY